MGDKSPKNATKVKKQKTDRKSGKSGSVQQVAPGEPKRT